MRVAIIKPFHKCCQCEGSLEEGQEAIMFYSYLLCSRSCFEKWVNIGLITVQINIDNKGDVE